MGINRGISRRSILTTSLTASVVASSYSSSLRPISETRHVPLSGHTRIASRLKTLLSGQKESSGIVDTTSGDTKFVELVSTFPDVVLTINDPERTIRTLCVDPKGSRLRTISYDGKVLDSKELPDLKADISPEMGWFVLSPKGDSIAYFDFRHHSLASADLITGQSTSVVSNLDVSVSKMAWTTHGILMEVWRDASETGTLKNAIAAIDPSSKQPQVLYRGGNLHGITRAFVLSPDCTKLLFIDDAAGERRSPSLLILDLQTKEVRTLLSAEDDSLNDVCWSPDGSSVAYTRGSSDTKLVVQSLVNGSSTNVAKISSNLIVEDLAFLDKERLLVSTEPEESTDPKQTVSVVTIKDGKLKKLCRGSFDGQILPIEGGKKFFCSLVRLG